jgi:hypothetical protein
MQRILVMRIMNYLGLTAIILLTLFLFPITVSAEYGG